MKKIILLTLALISTFCLALAFGCRPDGGGQGGTEGANIIWSGTEGATSYDIYRAPSRFGNYALIAEDVRGTGYKYDDYKFTDYYRVVARRGEAVLGGELVGGELELFGENVYIFSPSDDPEDVARVIENAYGEQEEAHFASARYAFYFKPGEYSDEITLSAGFYTTFAGLGRSAEEVSLRTLRCTDTWNTNALINFWRGAENLSFRSDILWAVSQGCYLRGIDVSGGANLWHTGASSGGFMANSSFTGTVNSGSQQQWLSRNSSWGGWQGSLWNMVFAGNAAGCAPFSGWQDGAWNTVVDTVPVIREKPYLIFENGEYSVFVPSLRTDSSGLYLPEEDGEARVIPLSDFYVAREGDSARTLNAALEEGKHLFFTPGIYTLEEPLSVKNDDTVVLGTGLATLVPANGQGCMITSGKDVTVAGLLFDASDSDFLLKVQGVSGAQRILLADCFFRAGGASDASTRVGTCLIIEADGVVADNIWTWRADHGHRWREQANQLAGVGWDVNMADTGVAVYGDDVTFYGLFSEHFRKNNVYWAGNGGKVIFFQSEIAYDIPAGGDGGSAAQISFVVDENVTSFSGTAMGVYTHFWNGGVVLDCGISVPDSPGVTLSNVVAIALSTNNDSHLTNAVNNVGGIVGAGSTQVRVLAYPAA